MRVKFPKLDKIFVLVILVSLILVGGILAAVIVNNRFTTERQNQHAQQEQKQKQDEQKQKKDQANSTRFTRSFCLSRADTAYEDYLKINSTSTYTDANGQTIYNMPQSNWNFADKQKQEAYDNCYKQFPN